jgi:hypothetical protein
MKAYHEQQEFELKVATPLDYVVSKNLCRRHLDEGQRAMVADKIATIKHGWNQHEKEDAQFCASSQGQAAKKLNVSRRSVQKARVVRSKGVPELIAAVTAGKVSVSGLFAAILSAACALERLAGNPIADEALKDCQSMQRTAC